MAFRATPALTGAAALLAAVSACGLLAVLNCGGYRYGASDQAFYIPAIRLQQSPSLFPHDRGMLNAQDRLMLFDEGMARVAEWAALQLPDLFLAGFLVSLALLAAGLISLGRLFYESWWGVAGLGLVLTLRHRIPRTGVNTFEGYLHPRMVAFALGVLALACFLRLRPWRSIALVAAAAIIHSTTALWFAMWLGAALIVSVPAWRRGLLMAAILGAAGAGWLVSAGPLGGGLAVMDAEWMSALSGKDYLLPTDWPLSAWLLNFAYVAVVFAVYGYRRRTGATLPREEGLVAGCAALAAVFLASLPFVAARVALAVQLQLPRIFWMLDFMASVYLVWLAVDASSQRSEAASRLRLRRITIIAVLAVVAAGRGGYVMFVEHPGRPVVQVDLAKDEWGDLMRWASGTPPGSHLLADPGHAWKYGSSVRVAAARDVYLEEVKDTAIGMYSRPIALRVAARIRDLGDFSSLTPERAIDLAAKYDLDYLLTERPVTLALAYQNRRFYAYRLAR